MNQLSPELQANFDALKRALTEETTMTDTEETKTRKPRMSPLEKHVQSARRKLQVAIEQHETRIIKSAKTLEAKREEILGPFTDEFRSKVLMVEFDDSE